MCLSTKKGQEKIENFTFNSPDVAAGVPIQVAVDRPRHAALVEQQRRAAAVSTAGGISCINRRASAHGFVRLGRAAVIRQRSQQRIARERRATGTIFDQVVGIGADASSVGSIPPTGGQRRSTNNPGSGWNGSSRAHAIRTSSARWGKTGVVAREEALGNRRANRAG